MEKHCRRQHKNTKSVATCRGSNAPPLPEPRDSRHRRDYNDTASYANYVVTYISNLLTTSLPVIYNVFARFNYETTSHLQRMQISRHLTRVIHIDQITAGHDTLAECNITPVKHSSGTHWSCQLAFLTAKYVKTFQSGIAVFVLDSDSL